MKANKLKLYVFWIEMKADKLLSNYFTFAENIGEAIRMAITYETQQNAIEGAKDYQITLNINVNEIQEFEVTFGQVGVETKRMKVKKGKT